MYVVFITSVGGRRRNRSSSYRRSYRISRHNWSNSSSRNCNHRRVSGNAAAGAATTIGIEAATATTLGTIAAGGTTTVLNVGIAEAGKSLVTSD
ncbi:hypothetical protein ABHC48_01995 [Ruminococcus sp. 1001136sp1]|uniref:hypothetical protein n=1 Tax=unclassified Ruminococcus TaxID=2608920 RepID=UPI00189F6E18|nr:MULTISPECIES: hypothetical protein [unclassified Ruminococcus]MDB8772103.1 hypothetical protein [Ruminococcus sp. 1001136sp1]MDB8784181.1 hypothetical protein [Ruminococcus sp. 1001136sp1]